jgi:hypothetical protein
MKQTIYYAIILVLWVIAIVLLVTGIFPYLFWFLLALHFLELILVGYKVGREYGVNAANSILLCMVFGFTWWLPLQKQIRSETFTDADFIKEG